MVQFTSRVISANPNGTFIERELAEKNRKKVLVYRLVKVDTYTQQRITVYQSKHIADIRKFWDDYEKSWAFYFTPRVVQITAKTRGTIATSLISRVILERVKI